MGVNRFWRKRQTKRQTKRHTGRGGRRDTQVEGVGGRSGEVEIERGRKERGGSEKRAKGRVVWKEGERGGEKELER